MSLQCHVLCITNLVEPCSVGGRMQESAVGAEPTRLQVGHFEFPLPDANGQKPATAPGRPGGGRR